MKFVQMVIILILFSTSNLLAQGSKYSSRIDIDHKFGSDRDLTQLEFFSPILQSDKSLWFIDLRGWLDDNDTSENNLGLGYRKIINDKYILGLYGFYDIRETDNDNEFKQKTFGIELLTENYDFRANYYDADEQKKLTNAQSVNSEPIIVGNQILVADQQSFETSFSGYDVEIGAKIPRIEDLSAFLAYYKFENDKSNIDLDGYRARAEYKVFKTNDRKHNIILEAEYCDDDFRDDITFFGFRYNYKFGKQESLNKLEQRMTNRVIRDIDIVVPQIIPTTKKILTNPDGSATNIKFVKLGATNNGDGSESSPYNSFTDFNTKFAANDVIYVLPHGDANDRDTANIQLLDGQKLVSAKIGIKVSDITGNLAHNFPIKQNSSAGEAKVKQILTGNNNLIQGFDVKNGDVISGNIIGTGIVINEKTGNIIKDNIVSGNSNTGIYVKTIDGQSNEVTSNTVGVNKSRGIYIDSHNNSKNIITSNVASGNKDDGIGILSRDDSTNIITSNTFSDNVGDGIFMQSHGRSKNTLTSNEVSNNERYGFYIPSYDSSENYIISNTVSNNVFNGIDIWSNDNSISIIKLNTFDNNDVQGIQIVSYDSSENYITLNVVTDNGYNGINIWLSDSSENEVTSNTISNSGTRNIDSNAEDTSNITIQNNIFSGTGGKTDVTGNTTTGGVAIDVDQLND